MTGSPSRADVEADAIRAITRAGADAVRSAYAAGFAEGRRAAKADVERELYSGGERFAAVMRADDGPPAPGAPAGGAA